METIEGRPRPFKPWVLGSNPSRLTIFSTTYKLRKRWPADLFSPCSAGFCVPRVHPTGGENHGPPFARTRGLCCDGRCARAGFRPARSRRIACRPAGTLDTPAILKREDPQRPGIPFAKREKYRTNQISNNQFVIKGLGQPRFSRKVARRSP